MRVMWMRYITFDPDDEIIALVVFLPGDAA